MNDRVFFATCVQPLLILLYNEHCRTLSSFYGSRTLTARRTPPMALRVAPDQILSRPSQTANADGTVASAHWLHATSPDYSSRHDRALSGRSMRFGRRISGEKGQVRAVEHARA